MQCAATEEEVRNGPVEPATSRWRRSRDISSSRHACDCRPLGSQRKSAGLRGASEDVCQKFPLGVCAATPRAPKHGHFAEIPALPDSLTSDPSGT